MEIKRINEEELLTVFPEHENGKLELPNGVITYWKGKRLHNEDGPSVIYPGGYGFEYRRKGSLHREDGLPAVKLDSRLEFHWWGKLHNTSGPAIHDADRNIQVWAQNGKKHRFNLPAVIHEPLGYVSYWDQGKRHRVNGPARIWTLENKEEWWIKDHQLSDAELEKVKKCFTPNDNTWPLIFGHPTLRPFAEYIKSGGKLSSEPVKFKEDDALDSELKFL